MDEEKAKLPESGAFEALAESASDAIICIDAEDTILFWNRAAERMFGFDRADALGRPLTIIIPDEYGERNRASLLRMAAGESPRLHGGTVALRARRADGTELPVEVSVSRWQNGSSHFFTAMIRDVSDRVALHDLVDTSEQDYRRLFEYAHDAILILEPATETVLAANRRACELYGMEHDRLVGRSIAEFSLDPAVGKRRISETLSAGGRHFFSTVQTKKDGTPMELEIAAAVVHYHGADAILSINRDVTARNVAQRELARERDFVSRVLDVAASLVIVLDRNGNILRFNQACERSSGRRAAEVVGRPFWEVLLPDEDVDTTRAEFERLRRGTFPSFFENRWRRADGALRRISWANTALVDVYGAPEFVVGTGIDVTEARQVEEQLATAQRLSHIGEVAASVAHEFNNVLMGISPFVSILEKRASADAATANATTHIGRAVARGRAIVGEILRYAQPAQPMRQEIDVHAFLAELARELMPQLGQRVTLSVEAPVGLSVMADAVQLHQVMWNLVLNARDAMPGGGRITIEVSRGTSGTPEFGLVTDPARFVHFRITDEGSGMSRETLDRLFEPLFTTKKSGTGLGLAVTYQIVRRHDGYVFVVSEPGRGTTFHVYLPSPVSS